MEERYRPIAAGDHMRAIIRVHQRLNSVTRKQLTEREKERARYSQDFPGGTVDRNRPINAGDTRSTPGPLMAHSKNSHVPNYRA